MAPQTPASTPYPLYSTTFTIHRVSPLYVGNTTLLNNETLSQHARRFRDILAGDVLRGVRVGLAPDDDTLARIGSLVAVKWRILGEEEDWEMEEDPQTEDTTIIGRRGRGILAKISYEYAEYTAILLRPTEESDENDSVMTVEQGEAFQQFPLLLTRMPNSLRDTFTEFLAATFDTRVSILHLGGNYVVGAFEKYIFDLTTAEDGRQQDAIESTRILRRIVKDVQVLIGFDLPNVSTSLKTVDVQIAGEDLPGMVKRGQKLNTNEPGTPFMDALNAYVKAHLAMDLRHEGVKVVRIACGGFVLGSEGKVKLSHPANDGDDGQTRATSLLVAGLIKHAKSRRLLQQTERS